MRPPLLVLLLLTAPGCLVASVNPAHVRDAIIWEPGLIGEWQSTDDNASITIERGEWQSYLIEYAHPVEKGRLTGHLTLIGTQQYLDVMPARGQDHGSFLLPLHLLLKVTLEGDRLELAPLSYDWFSDRVRRKAPVPGLTVVLDEKENALIASSSAALRAWVRRQPDKAGSFGPPAVFVRKKGA